MLNIILPLIPEHALYCEPFCGGGAVFFAKKQSKVEVINDTNLEAVNFFAVVKTKFGELKKIISQTLHSRDAHRRANVIYNNPDMFDSVQRAWAFYTLANQSYNNDLKAGENKKENRNIDG
ncbi:MAG: DNA adenine methylase [Prevotellaceae bacterium]|jgi:DNA adenine methylase|nr:DNA adenine methylase [Prevotellaceae bacterium]